MNIKRIPESQGFIQRVGEWAVRQHTFMPRMIDLEVSRVCNLDCPACMRRAPTSLAEINKGKRVFRTLEDFRAVHEQIPTLGTLNFMGDGEPLMNPELGDIIHYASLNDIHTVVTTNATLLTERVVEQWEKDKVYKVHASVDAPTKALYERVRKGAIWEKTYENLRLLGESSIPFCINIVLTQDTIQEMDLTVSLCKAVGAREVTFLMPICAYGTDMGIRPEFSPENVAMFGKTRWLCQQMGIRWVFPLTLEPTFRRFSFPFIRPQISLEGDLWACCYALGRGPNWTFNHRIDIAPGTYLMGNMFGEGFAEVWWGSTYEELRDVYKRTEIPKGTVISRKDYLSKVAEVEGRKPRGRFDHCEICPARWGLACS